MAGVNVFSKWPTLGAVPVADSCKDAPASTHAAYFSQWMKVSGEDNEACEQQDYGGANDQRKDVTAGNAMGSAEDVERDQQVCRLNFALSTMGPSFEQTVASIWHEAIHGKPAYGKGETRCWEVAVLRSVEWLCHGVRAAARVKLDFPSQRLVHHALEHIVLCETPASQGGGGGDGKGKDTNPHCAWSLPPSFIPLGRSPQGAVPFRPVLVMLLFHRQADVRIRAREALLACVDRAFTAAPDSLPSDTSWKSPDAMSPAPGPSATSTCAAMSGVLANNLPQLSADRHNGNTSSGCADSHSLSKHPSQGSFGSICVEKTLLGHRLQALWRLSLEILCALKHITQIRFPLLQGGPHVPPPSLLQRPPHPAEATTVMAEGVYHLFVVLTALDQRITKATNDRSALLQEPVSGQRPQPPHPVTVLLLGGSMSFEWLFDAHEDLAKGMLSSITPSLLWCIAGYNDKEKEEEVSRLVHFRAMRDLVEGLNEGLRHDQTLQPILFAVQVKKALAKVMIHALLEYARVTRGSSPSAPLSLGKDELSWRVRRLSGCWWLAGALDAPSFAISSTADEPSAGGLGGAVPDTATAAPERTCLYWILGPLLKNAHTQWRVEEVVVVARTRPAGTTPPSVENDEPMRTTMLECTVHSYYLLFCTLFKTMPDAVASTFFHNVLEKYERIVNALAVGGVLRHGSLHAIHLFGFLFRADLLAFSDAGHIWVRDERAVNGSPALKRALGDAWASSSKVTMKTKPLSCLQRAWTNYPIVLKHVLGCNHLSAFPSVLEQLIGVLSVFVNISTSVARCSQWLLLLPGDPSWPQPLGWVMKNFLAQLLEFFEVHARRIKEKWAAADPSAALSRLLTSDLDIPWLVCCLKHAQSPQLRHLAGLLNEIFLDNLGPTAQLIFASDAAQWLLQDVLLQQEPLAGFARGAAWLQLHHARVDSLARQQGGQWLRVLAACNWGSMRAGDRESGAPCSAAPSWVCTVASAWWMAALLVDVVALDANERRMLLKHVAIELPQPPFSCLPRDAAKLYEIVRHLFLCLLEKHVTYPQDVLLSALLHVASMLPSGKAEADIRLRNEAKRPMMAFLDRYLLKESRQTLSRYAPVWLTRIIQSATSSIDASLVEQARSFERLEWQEAQLAITNEAKRVQDEHDTKVRQWSEPMRLQEMDVARALAQSDKRNSNGNDPNFVVGRKRARKPPWMEDESGSDSSSGIAVVGSAASPRSLPTRKASSLMVTFNTPATCADALCTRTSRTNAGAAVQTTQQRQRQAANEHKLRKLRFNEYESEVTKAMRGVVGRTRILFHRAQVNDIIGNETHCLAEELPKLPQVYVMNTEMTSKKDSSTLTTSASAASPYHVNHQAARLYVHSFVPHVALELRCGIISEVNECTNAASKEDCAQSMKDKSSSSPKQTLSQVLSRCFPLNNWVSKETVPVVHTSVAESDPLDPSRLNFNVKITTDLGTRNLGQFGEDDLVLVLLPLTVVFTAWLRQRQAQRGSGSDSEATVDEACIKYADGILDRVPERWRIFGCFPQLCYVHSADPRKQLLTLSCHPQQTTTGAARQGLHGNTLHAEEERECGSARGAGNPLPSVANALPFVHALRLGFKCAANVFYIKWIGSMNPTISTLRTLFGISNTHFASTVFDPRVTSAVSRIYYDSMKRYLSQPNVMNYIRDRLLMQRSLNDWQAKVVAAILYAVVPLWSSNEPLRDSARNERCAVGGANGIPPFGGCQGVPTPEIHIVEGPPGTGKTQTVSTLILNLLHYMPPGSRTLLCGPSNSAVDEALLRVHSLQKLLLDCESSRLPSATATPAARAELLRVGLRQKVSMDVLKLRPCLFLDDKADAIGQESSTRNATSAAPSPSRYNAGFREISSIRNQLIASSPVVFTTLGSLHRIQRLNVRFDVVIVDEASQATEPNTLQALVSAKGKCILVGDWKQLQPTILYPESARCGFQQSLLQRLLLNGYPFHSLRTQYRMHPDICAFPNRYFYRGKLQTDLSVLQRPRGGGPLPHRGTEGRGQSHEAAQASLPPCKQTVAQKLGSITRLAFVDVPDGVMQRGRGNSWRNTREAEAVVKLMRQIRDYLGLTVNDFAQHAGIITYYAAQRDAILQALTPDERHSGIQIATVDSFQGKEKDIILISCVRASVNPNASGRGPGSEPCSEVGKNSRSEASESESLTDASPEVFSAGLGFLSNWHRINVSLTRARELCIVFGHRATLEAVARRDIQTSRGSATPCAVGVAECRGVDMVLHNASRNKAIGYTPSADEDPFVMSEFIQHVAQCDGSAGGRAEGWKPGGACNQVSSKNAPMCILSDSSAEDEASDEVCSVRDSASTCQAACLTFTKKILLMRHLKRE